MLKHLNILELEVFKLFSIIFLTFLKEKIRIELMLTSPLLFLKNYYEIEEGNETGCPNFSLGYTNWLYAELA